VKKLAIVSSYNEQCGNATYTEALRRGFSKYYEVDVLSLDIFLLRSEISGEISRLASKHIEDLAEKLRDYDYVNIQFEAGLFGVLPDQIFQRVVVLIRASKNLVFTMHRFEKKAPILSKKSIHFLMKLKFREFFIEILTSYKRNSFSKLYHKLVKKCITAGASIVFHTKRDAKFVRLFYNYDKIYDRPISFLDLSDYDFHLSKVNRSEFKRKYSISEETVCIGLFGFISEYKGHHSAIHALKFLPKNYKLLIFGGQHPQGIQPYSRIDSYIEELLKLINKWKLWDRVSFFSNLDDENFIDALLSSDVTILPYMETMQGGSGVASLTLELRVKAIFSMNFAFLELAKYAPGALDMFSIGNSIELAKKIERLSCLEKNPLEDALKKYHETYNLESNILFYRSLFERILNK
jgi:glycosyltransferase involved in cell wall biosynthesis